MTTELLAGANNGDIPVWDAASSSWLPAQIESSMVLHDVSTGNATVSAHGFAPKLSGTRADVLCGDGSFRPSGSTTIWGPPLGFSSYGTALTANSLYLVKFNVMTPCTLTGMQVSVDTPTGGHVKIGLWNAAGTTLLASSGSVLLTSQWGVQCIPFTAAYAADPGTYLMGFVPDNATTHFIVQNPPCPSAIVAVGSYAIPATASVPALTDRAGNIPVTMTY